MDTIWLGYDGLDLPLGEISAVLRYQPVFDKRIEQAYGQVPPGVRAVIVTQAGAYVPARWEAQQIRQRWAAWRLEGV
jgi:hypothetical protein